MTLAHMIVRGGDFLSVFDKPQRDAVAMVFLDPASKWSFLFKTGFEVN